MSSYFCSYGGCKHPESFKCAQMQGNTQSIVCSCPCHRTEDTPDVTLREIMEAKEEFEYQLGLQLSELIGQFEKKTGITFSEAFLIHSS